MPDWRDPADYAYCSALSREQWAWELLRRNPEYRRDWAWFRDTWEALEEAYGRPPHRDFLRWRQDPRAYRAADDAWSCNGSAPTGTCGEGERLLIECWMGSKWGFYKFPLDPDRASPALGDELAWREVERSTVLVRPDDHRYFESGGPRLALGFDLSYPLPEQIEEAKRFLIILQRRLRQEGRLALQTVVHCRARWTLCLRALDAESAGTCASEIAATLLPAESYASGEVQALLEEAHRLVGGGYRDILLLPEA
jgi:hypothetical protein